MDVSVGSDSDNLDLTGDSLSMPPLTVLTWQPSPRPPTPVPHYSPLRTNLHIFTSLPLLSMQMSGVVGATAAVRVGTAFSGHRPRILFAEPVYQNVPATISTVSCLNV